MGKYHREIDETGNYMRWLARLVLFARPFSLYRRCIRGKEGYIVRLKTASEGKEVFSFFIPFTSNSILAIPYLSTSSVIESFIGALQSFDISIAKKQNLDRRKER